MNPNRATEKNNTDTRDGVPHYVGSWQKYCPTCGDKNPEFKDETVCKDCGTHLGSKKTVEKMVTCPHCGGKNAKPL